MLSSYVSFTCVAVEPGLFSAYWILSYETPETKPLRPVAGIDRTVSSMHQRVQQTSIMHGMDTLFTRTLRSRKIWFYQDTKSSSCLLNHTSLSIFEFRNYFVHHQTTTTTSTTLDTTNGAPSVLTMMLVPPVHLTAPVLQAWYLSVSIE